MIHRREVLAGVAAACAVPAAAQPTRRLFATGPLASNIVALGFSVPRRDYTPDPALLAASGPKRWRDLAGKPHLVSLWAEWCAPCLAEAGDIARLAAAYRDKGVGVIGILTGSRKPLDLPSAEALMAKVHAQDLPIWIEPNGGHELLRTLAAFGSSGASSLPCNLILDASGKVRGRAFGSPVVAPTPAPGERLVVRRGALTEADKVRMVEHPLPTYWTTPYATELMDALAAGVLNP
jgi:thiol-disulfide isomerase/thioredoxin